MFVVDSKRIKTMRLRLGKDASEIIKDDRFLPFFRNRQKQYPKEFAESVKIAKKKRSPYNYLSTVWKKSNILKTLDWIGKILNRFVRKTFKKFHKTDTYITQVNYIGRQRILEEYRKHRCFRI